MGYVEKHSAGQRTGVMLAVALLHGAVAAGVMAAFAGGVLTIPKDPWKPGARIDPEVKVTPLPEPTRTTEQKPVETTTFAPTPPIHFDGGSTISITNIPADPLPQVKPIELTPPPLPAPSSGFMPRAARPLGKPGLWVTNDDYPTGAMRRGEQGVTGFRVTVGPDGRVRDCTVTRSSGSAELDSATCAKVSARARFAAATDSSGEAVAGTYGNSIRWEIPH